MLLPPQLWKLSHHLLPLGSRPAPDVPRAGGPQAVADPILQRQSCLRCCRCSTHCCCRCSSSGCCCCWPSCCNLCGGCCSSCGGSGAAKKKKTNEEGGPRTMWATVHPKTNEKEGSIYQQSCNLSQFLFITGIAVNCWTAAVGGCRHQNIGQHLFHYSSILAHPSFHMFCIHTSALFQIFNLTKIPFCTQQLKSGIFQDHRHPHIYSIADW